MSSETVGSPRKFPEGQMQDQALYFYIMNTTCTVCKEAVVPQQGLALVRGHPYNDITHYKCRMHIQQDTDWPHDFPAETYKQLAISNANEQEQPHELDRIQSVGSQAR